jgi:predicted nucleic acid-binding protein
MNPTRLVLDTGVLYAAFDVGDVQYHSIASAGFLSLARSGTRLIVPSCVVLEVAKRLLFDVSIEAMQKATAAMLETLDVRDTTVAVLQTALELVQSKQQWGATLEDAIVMNTALGLGVPVWTLNYRDFAAVKNLEFWTPE